MASEIVISLSRETVTSPQPQRNHAMNEYTIDDDICKLDNGKYSIAQHQVMVVKNRGKYVPYLQTFFNWELTERVERLPRGVRLIFRKLIHNVHVENRAVITCEKIAQELGLSSRSVYNGLSILHTHNLIKKAGPGIYLITPYLIWRGSQDILRDAMGEWDYDSYKDDIT